MLAAALLAALSHWMLALVVFPCLLVAVRPVVLFRSTVVLAVPPQAVLLPWPLAMSAALDGYKVLMIDLDSQGSMTSIFGAQVADEWGTVFPLLAQPSC